MTESGYLTPWHLPLDLILWGALQRDSVRYAASLSVARSAAQTQGMSSSMRDAGHRLTSLVSTSVK